MIHNANTLPLEYAEIIKGYADLYTGSDKYTSLDPDGEDTFE